jgi:hypothetical protein
VLGRYWDICADPFGTSHERKEYHVSIDGVRGLGGPKPALGPSITGPNRPETHGDPFAVSITAPTAAVSDVLAALQRGEITLDQYVDARLIEATRHLDSHLDKDRINFVRDTLREHTATDPVLERLIQRATGQSAGSTKT